MNAVIRLKASDLNAALPERIRGLVNNDNADITISLRDRSDYFETLNRSKKDMEENYNLVSFSIDELQEYTERYKG